METNTLTITLFGQGGRIGAQLLGADHVQTGWGSTANEALARLTTNITAMPSDYYREFFGPLLVAQASSKAG